MSMPPEDGPQIELDGVLYTFVRYGDELLDGVSPYSTQCHICGCAPGDLHGGHCPMGAGRPHRRPEHCRDCGVPIGSFHVGGCGVEECPNCGQQFASCDCNETLDGVEMDYPGDNEEQVADELSSVGARLPNEPGEGITMNKDQSPNDPIDAAVVAEIAAALTRMHDDEDAGFAAVTQAIAGSFTDGLEFGVVRNLGTWWVVIVIEASRGLDDASTPTIAVSADGELLAGPWDDVRRADGLILDRDASFVGEMWHEWFESELIPPFHLDADAWEGAVCGADTESTFRVIHHGDPCMFQAIEHSLWGIGPPGIRTGTWVSAIGEYWAAWIESDVYGCLWGHVSEFGTVFLGRPTSEEPSPADQLWEVVDTLAAGGQFEISELSSDFLTAAELASHIGLVKITDPNFDPDIFTVRGTDMTVIANELMGGSGTEDPA
jgi:hypothetical protein